MKRGFQQLNSIASHLGNNQGSKERRMVSEPECDFHRVECECCDEIGGIDCGSMPSKSNKSPQCNKSNESDSETEIQFEKSIFSEEEYLFLRDYYDNESNDTIDEDLLSVHSFTSIDRVVTDVKLEELMRKILRFAVKARLTESCLSQALDLFRETFSSYGTISTSDLHHFTLKGFYNYFFMNQKTRIIRYCNDCKQYDKRSGKSTCNCGTKWRELSNFCYLRPLKFQMDERKFWNPDFRNLFHSEVGEISEQHDLINDRTDGSVYQNQHREQYNKQQIDCVTGFFDSVSPFKNAKHSFYQASINFTEMKPHYRKKLVNNFLWFFAPKKPNHDEINIYLKILMDDLNHYNSLSNRKIRMERIVCDLPARSEILFFKQSGEYFCHICLVKGESVDLESAKSNSKPLKQTRYPLRIHPIYETIKLAPFRDKEYWINYIQQGKFDQGLKSVSPILDQDWNPSPSDICCYDSMHVLYEGIFQEMMKIIPVQYWERFDSLFMKQKYPSFMHKHPRKTTNGQIMNSLKAIEVYMICHYYLEIFLHIEGYNEIESTVEIIHRFVTVIDKLTDSFQLSKLEEIEIELFQVLIDYQNIVGEKKATPNFHICTELVNSCRMYGPLGVNSAFIGEGLNFTLSKTYVCSNSARYSIMYFDMCQLCDLLDLNESLIASECVVGHYVLRKELDCIKDIKTNEVFKVASFSKDFNEITLISNSSKKKRVISRTEAFEMLPCVVLKLPNEEKYIPMHYYAYQYF